jgi:hypothetical protein
MLARSPPRPQPMSGHHERRHPRDAAARLLTHRHRAARAPAPPTVRAWCAPPARGRSLHAEGERTAVGLAAGTAGSLRLAGSAAATSTAVRVAPRAVRGARSLRLPVRPPRSRCRTPVGRGARTTPQAGRNGRRPGHSHIAIDAGTPIAVGVPAPQAVCQAPRCQCAPAPKSLLPSARRAAPPTMPRLERPTAVRGCRAPMRSLWRRHQRRASPGRSRPARSRIDPWRLHTAAPLRRSDWSTVPVWRRPSGPNSRTARRGGVFHVKHRALSTKSSLCCPRAPERGCGASRPHHPSAVQPTTSRRPQGALRAVLRRRMIVRGSGDQSCEGFISRAIRSRSSTEPNSTTMRPLR